MAMGQLGKDLGLFSKALPFLLREVGQQHLDCCLLIEIDMLTQVDFGKAALAQQALEAILAQLLTCPIRHSNPPRHVACCLESDSALTCGSILAQSGGEVKLNEPK